MTTVTTLCDFTQNKADGRDPYEIKKLLLQDMCPVQALLRRTVRGTYLVQALLGGQAQAQRAAFRRIVGLVY